MRENGLGHPRSQQSGALGFAFCNNKVICIRLKARSAGKLTLDHGILDTCPPRKYRRKRRIRRPEHDKNAAGDITRVGAVVGHMHGLEKAVEAIVENLESPMAMLA